MNKIYTESGITDENEQKNLNQRVTDNKSFIVKKISEEIKKEKINLNDENDKESKIAILAVEVIKKYINAEKNVLFFGEIKDLNEEEYLKLIDDISKVNLNKTYSRQIKINSVIAQSKYDKFKWAAWITIIGTVNLISALMVKVVLFG